jgi:hypothetical protein
VALVEDERVERRDLVNQLADGGVRAAPTVGDDDPEGLVPAPGQRVGLLRAGHVRAVFENDDARRKTA